MSRPLSWLTGAVQTPGQSRAGTAAGTGSGPRNATVRGQRTEDRGQKTVSSFQFLETTSSRCSRAVPEGADLGDLDQVIVGVADVNGGVAILEGDFPGERDALLGQVRLHRGEIARADP